MLGFFARLCSTLCGWRGGDPGTQDDVKCATTLKPCASNSIVIEPETAAGSEAPATKPANVPRASYLSVEQLLRLPVEVQMHIVAFMGPTEMLEMAYAAPLFKAFITAVPKYWEYLNLIGGIAENEYCEFAFGKRFPSNDWTLAVAFPPESRGSTCGVWFWRLRLDRDLCEPQRAQAVTRFTESVHILANNSRVGVVSVVGAITGRTWKPDLRANIINITDVLQFRDKWPNGSEIYGARAMRVDWEYVVYDDGLWKKFVDAVHGLPQVKALSVCLPDVIHQLPELPMLKVQTMNIFYALPPAERESCYTPPSTVYESPSLVVIFFRQMITEWLNGEREIDRILILAQAWKRSWPSSFRSTGLPYLVADLADGLPGCFKICASTWLIRRNETSRDGLVISVQTSLFALCRCDYRERRERSFEESLLHSKAYAILLEAHENLWGKGYGRCDEYTLNKRMRLEREARNYLHEYGALPRRVAVCDFTICASLCFDYDWDWFRTQRRVWRLLESYRTGEAHNFFGWDD